ncbi:hypothetical protein [Bacillus sonorensis]|uniref:hypothetical protein n=1 Tax=Bacillus sonorensis TaxID=119858 RepID=UPI00227E66DE|nr:hypothetical protein [Bacillus sonorensis]MCY8035617.1 hypothetical protein [Bacillus sonorensis]MCY8563678.1 hypothetical protein [Bacillus sonorensis]
MIIAFKIILLLIMILSFIGVIGEKENKKLRDNMTAVCLASMISAVVAFIML